MPLSLELFFPDQAGTEASARVLYYIIRYDEEFRAVSALSA